VSIFAASTRSALTSSISTARLPGSVLRSTVPRTRIERMRTCGGRNGWPGRGSPSFDLQSKRSRSVPQRSLRRSSVWPPPPPASPVPLPRCAGEDSRCRLRSPVTASASPPPTPPVHCRSPRARAGRARGCCTRCRPPRGHPRESGDLRFNATPQKTAVPAFAGMTP